jgi:hypothetical protein
VYSEIALSRKPSGIGHTYVYNFLLRMTDTMTSQNIDLSSCDTLYIDESHVCYSVITVKSSCEEDQNVASVDAMLESALLCSPLPKKARIVPLESSTS